MTSTTDRAPADRLLMTEERSWTARDAVIYALGVGAGAKDRQAELPQTCEEDPELQVIPSYGTVLARRAEGLLEHLGVDRTTAKIVHGEQHLELHRDIPAHGTLHATSRIVACSTKSTGTVVWARTEASHEGRPLLTSHSASFVRGASLSPFGTAPDLPTAEFELGPGVRTIEQATRPEQALWYRLSGDLNPLHVDDDVARDAGFEVPILHGLCTFGFATRHLMSTVPDGHRLRRIGGRFRGPVLPGEGLTTRLRWDTASSATFDVVSTSGVQAISRGYAEVVAL
jgi:acyl dehydratase